MQSDQTDQIAITVSDAQPVTPASHPSGMATPDRVPFPSPSPLSSSGAPSPFWGIPSSSPGSFITPSTFDADSIRRSLIDIPRSLVFAPPGPNDSHYTRREAYRVSEEDEDEDDERSDVEGLEQSRRHANYFGSGGGGPVNARMPLLAQSRSSSISSPHMSLAGDAYHHFTPQTRRTYLQHKIDHLKLQSALARRNWFLCLRTNPFTRSRLLLAGALIGIACSSASEMVLRKSLASNMYPYRWFLFQAVTLATFALCAAIAVRQRKSVAHFVRHHGVPYRFLALSSLIDAIHAISLMLAVGVLPATWGVLVPQLTIPFSLLFRFFVTNGERCGFTGAVGSGMICAAVIMSVAPELIAYSSCSPSHVADADARHELLINLILLVVGIVPNAASNIYKQSYLQQHAMSMPLMNVALSGLQLVWGVVLAPIALLLQTEGTTGIESIGDTSSSIVTVLWKPSGDGGVIDLTADVGSNVLTNFVSGWQCIFGVDSITGDQCQALLVFVMSRAHRESIVASSLTGGVVLALLLFRLPSVSSLLPAWEFGRCLPEPGWTAIALVAIIAAGTIVGQWQPSQQPMDLDVWARLEEIAAVEEEDQRRRDRQRTRQASLKR